MWPVKTIKFNDILQRRVKKYKRKEKTDKKNVCLDLIENKLKYI